MNLNTYHNHRMPRFIMVVAIALIAYGSKSACTASASDKDSGGLTANITFSNGKGLVAEISSDSEFRIKTCAGKLKFPLSSLAKIEMSEVPNLATVHLASGDRWVAEVADNILSRLNIENSEELINQYGEISSIYFNSPQETRSPKPLHYMKLILDDGSQALIDSAEILLSLETIAGKSKFSIGALRALKFIKPAGTDEPDSVIVRFHTGLVKRIDLWSAKNYIRTTDFSENKLKIYHRDILGILSATSAEDNSISTTDNALNTYQIMLKNGQTKTASLPISIWQFRTDLGTILIPSPMVASLKSNLEEDGTHILMTVYGEIFLGKLLNHELQVIYSKDKITDIELDDINEIRTDSVTMLAPNKWLVWYMKSGTAMVGCFANASAGLVTDGELEIESDNIFNLTPIENGSSFLNVTKNGQTAICTPISRRVKIVLLTTGMMVSIPWDDVYIVKAQKVITPTTVQNFRATVKRKKIKKTKRASTTKNSRENDIEDKVIAETENIKLRSAIGTLDLQPSVIATIAIDKTASKASVRSIYNDRFMVSIPTKIWLEDLLNIKDYEFPEDDVFEIKTGNSLSPVSAKNSFICRLITGDILQGKLPKQDLRIKKNGSKSAPIKVDVSKLKQISRNDDGELIFHLQRGNIFATPKQRHLKAVLWVSGNTNKIAFKQIESLIIDSAELPPTTHFQPGMPADLKNEVLVEGGTFMQGSENGIPNEMPVHAASVSSFYMDSTEVTRAQFAAFVRDTGYETLAEQNDSSTTWKSPGFIQRQNDPAVYISWNDAIEYCNWRSDETDLPQCYTIEKDGVVVSDRTAMGYRLPTEAEWEFAARNRGQNNIYAWNRTSTQQTALANYHQVSSSSDRWAWTNPVQIFPANGLEIFGLSGNVWEWCEDLYFDMAYSALQNNSVHNPCITHESAPGLSRRVMRGGSFKNRLDLLRCTSRGNGQPFAFSNHVGFRCVRNAE